MKPSLVLICALPSEVMDKRTIDVDFLIEGKCGVETGLFVASVSFRTCCRLGRLLRTVVLSTSDRTAGIELFSESLLTGTGSLSREEIGRTPFPGSCSSGPGEPSDSAVGS